MIYATIISNEAYADVLNPHLVYAAFLHEPPNVDVEGFIFDLETGLAIFDSVTGLPIAI